MYYIFSRLCLASSEIDARSPFDLCHGYPVLHQNKMETYYKHLLQYHNSTVSQVFIHSRPNIGSGKGYRETNYLIKVLNTI